MFLSSNVLLHLNSSVLLSTRRNVLPLLSSSALLFTRRNAPQHTRKNAPDMDMNRSVPLFQKNRAVRFQSSLVHRSLGSPATKYLEPSAGMFQDNNVNRFLGSLARKFPSRSA